jgi:alkylation response protein AidB-like acyl-CoA dehydrogenase
LPFTAFVSLSLRNLTSSLLNEANDSGKERRSLKEITDALKTEGVFSMLVPTRHGGLGLAAPDAINVIKELARLNGDVAWNVMTGQTASLIPFMATLVHARNYVPAGAAIMDRLSAAQ